MRRAMGNIAHRDRLLLLILAADEGLTEAEAAAVLGIPIADVRADYARAVDVLVAAGRRAGLPAGA